MALTDHAREVRSLLTDAGRLCDGLGIGKGAIRQASGLMICCPAHGERNPSCSVTQGPDGTLRAKCFACDWSADALGLIAMVDGLDTRQPDQFREVMARGATIGGDYRLAEEILDGRPMPDRPKVAPPAAREARTYPPQGEVMGVWGAAIPPGDDADAARYLVGRVIDPELVGARGLARVATGALPRWAAYRGRSWLETGHRLVCRVFDSTGSPRSLRAIQIMGHEGPKRLPPAGHKAAELAMLNEAAWRMMRGDSPGRIGVVEGEPDFLWWGTRTEEPLVGLVSGSWTEAFAASVPRGCRVVIRTHNDEAGDRYADQVAESLKHKCELIRRTPEAA